MPVGTARLACVRHTTSPPSSQCCLSWLSTHQRSLLCCSRYVSKHCGFVLAYITALCECCSVVQASATSELYSHLLANTTLAYACAPTRTYYEQWGQLMTAIKSIVCILHHITLLHTILRSCHAASHTGACGWHAACIVVPQRSTCG